MLDLSTAQRFEPAASSRRSEAMAWVMFALMAPVVGFSSVEEGIGRAGMVVFVVFLGLSALLMSFGNWVDRRTVMMVSASEIHFENGLRNVTIPWNAIERLEVHQDRLGKRAHVFGGEKYFAFRVLVELKMGGQVGFERGEEILDTILAKAELERQPSEEGGSVYYYLRE